MALIVTPVLILTPWGNLVDAHLTREDLGTLGLLMLALVVVAIMLGFPTAFTLMGMGVFFAWLAYRSVNPALAANQTLDLMVQRDLRGDVERRADRGFRCSSSWATWSSARR